MISKLQNWLISVLILCLGLNGFARAEQQEIQTFMTFGCTSWNSVIKDMSAISNPLYAALANSIVLAYLGNDLNNASDLNAPIGFALQKFTGETDGNAAQLLCIPIKNPAALLDFMAKNMDGKVESTQREDGIIEWNGYLLKEVNGFTWFVTDERQLAQLDSLDPKTFFAVQEDLSFQFTFDPQGFSELTTKLTEAYKEGTELALKKENDESDEEFDLRKKLVEEQNKLYNMFLESTQKISIGMGINKNEKALAMNTKVSFVPNSEGANYLQKKTDAKSLFTGFAQAKGLFRGYGIPVHFPNLQEMPTTPAQAALEDLLNQFKSCSGYVLDGEKGAHDLVFASTTEQIAKVQEACANAVKELKGKIGEQFKDEWFQPNVQAHGMTFTQLTIPTDVLLRIISDELHEKIDENKQKVLKDWVGDSISFVAGGKENQLYAGIGTDPIKKLGECLDNQPAAHFSEMTIDLRRLLSYIENLLTFARENNLIDTDALTKTQALLAQGKEIVGKNVDENSDEENQDVLSQIETLIRDLNKTISGTEKTNIRMTVDFSENELLVQFLGEEGILKILGKLSTRVLSNQINNIQL